MVETKHKKRYLLNLNRPLPPDLDGNGVKPVKIKDPIDDFTSRFELPRIHFKPIDGIDFFQENSLSVTANMSYTEVVGFTAPMGHEGVLKFIGQGADSAGLFIDTRWQLLLNNAPYRGWFDVRFQRGTLYQPASVTVLMPPSSILSLQIRNTTGNTYTARGILIGWTWTVKDRHYATMES